MSGEPKHRKLYDLLKGEILGGKYGAARAFPSEAQLSRRCGCSRITVSIPRDVMLAGFDGMDISRVMTAALTTIRQPYAEIARMVFDVLMRRVRGENCSPFRVLMPGKLVVRASTQREDAGRTSRRKSKCL